MKSFSLLLGCNYFYRLFACRYDINAGRFEGNLFRFGLRRAVINELSGEAVNAEDFACPEAADMQDAAGGEGFQGGWECDICISGVIVLHNRSELLPHRSDSV